MDNTMSQRKITFRAVPESEIDPQIAAVLKPDELVYWQGRPEKGGFPPMLIFLMIFAIIAAWAGGVHDLQAVEALLGESIATLKSLWQRLPWAFALFALLPIGLVIGYWPRQERYALTDQRVFKLRSGKMKEQARPEQLMLPKKSTRITIGKRSSIGDVRWANAETYERNRHMDRRSYVYFRKIRDPDQAIRMLEAWQQQWLDARNREASAWPNRSARRQSNSMLPPARPRKTGSAARRQRREFNASSTPGTAFRSTCRRPGTSRSSRTTTGLCASSASRYSSASFVRERRGHGIRRTTSHGTASCWSAVHRWG